MGAEILVHPAALVESPAGPVSSRLWHHQGQHSVGGRWAPRNFLWCMNSLDQGDGMEKE